MVADGMGGHKGGDRASKIAIAAALSTYQSSRAQGKSSREAVEDALNNAAAKVYQEGMKNGDLKGMGTTLSILSIEDDQAAIGHIGDTRIYLVRGREMELITNDHSLVNEQVQAGIMTEEEARTSSLRNIITRAIGHNEIVRPDYISLSINKNDMFLLCTDGLTNMLIDGEIVEIINNNTPPQAVVSLITEANRKGGDDNISVILMKIDNPA